MTVEADSGNDIYRIHSGSNIHVTLGQGHKTIVGGVLGEITVTENWFGTTSGRHITVQSSSFANIRTGGGNDHIESLGVFRAHVDAGHGNNNVVVNGANSRAVTGNGHDTIRAGGLHTYVNAGGGNDNIHVTSAIGEVHGGSGNDQIHLNAVAGHVDGGYGDDTYRIYAAGANLTDHHGTNYIHFNALGGNIQLGGGNDVIYANVVGVNVNAGHGNNRIELGALGANITAGNGHDIINVHAAGGGAVNAGHGNNTVNFTGAVADIQVGDGHDTINANVIGVNINAREGNNTINVRAAGASITAGNGNDTANIFAGAGGVVSLGHGDNTVNFTGGIAVVNVGDGDDTVNIDVVGANINTNGGDDTIRVRAVGATVNAGSGENLFDIEAAGASLTAGSGDDYAYVGAGVGLLDLGEGDNYVDLRALGGSVNVGDGDDSIFVKVLGASIDAGNGDNIIDARGFGVNATTGSGNDSIFSIGAGGQSIDSGNGNDLIHAFGGVNIVSAGHGHNNVTVGGALNVVQAGYGDNVIGSYGGSNTILSGHGNNFIDAYGGANIVLTGNGNNDIDALGGLNIVLAGDGRNKIYAAGGANIIMTGNGGVTDNTQRHVPTIDDLGANLVANGSFEAGAHARPEGGFSFGTPDGWTVAQSTVTEFHTDGLGGVETSSGRTFIELAANGENTAIYQDIGTRQNSVYEVAIDYRLRSASNPEHQAVEVYWAGERLGTLNNGTDWTTYTFRISGDVGDTSRLELRAVGDNPGFGGLIDNVRVQEVIALRAPENTIHSAAIATEYDGSGEYSDLGDFTSGGQMTIAGTARFDGVNNWERVFDFGGNRTTNTDTEGGNILLTRVGNTNDLRFEFNEGGAGSTKITISDYIEQGTEFDFSAVIDDQANELRLYLNGELAGSETLHGDVAERVRANNYVGRSNWDPDEAFEGSIQNFQVLNEAADLAQAQSLRTELASGPAVVAELLAEGQVPVGLLSSGQAVFDGSGAYADLGNFESGGQMTIAGTARFDGSNNWERIFDFGGNRSGNADPEGGNLVLARQGTSNNLVFAFNEGSSGYTEIVAANAIQHGEKIDFAAVVDNDSDELRLYLNGELSGTAALHGDVSQQIRNNNYVGRSNWENDASFHGAVENFQVLNEAVTLDEAQALRGSVATNSANVLNGAESIAGYDGTQNFSGGSHNDLGDFTTGGQLTITGKARFDGNNSYERIFDFGGNRTTNTDVAGGNILLARQGTSNNLTFQFTESGIGGTAVTVENVIQQGEEFDFAAVVDDQANELRLYLDGELAGSATLHGDVAERVRANNYVGRSNWENDAAFDGQVSDFAVYDRVLSESQIEAIHDGPLVVAELRGQNDVVEPGNEIEAYGTGNLIVSGSGDDRIRAGSLLGIGTAAAVTAANNSEDDFVRGAFGTDDGTIYGEENLGSSFTNLLSGLGNLGNVIIAGNGDNVVKSYGGANIIQAGSGDDYIVAYGLANGVVAGDGNNKLQLIGAQNAVWGGNGNDEVHFIGDDNLFILGDGSNRVTGFAPSFFVPPGVNNVTGLVGNVIIGAGGVDDVLVFGTQNFLLLGGGNNIAIAFGKTNVIQGASGNDFFVGLGAGNFVNAGDGDNFLVLGGLLNFALTGAGNDVSFQLGTDNIGFYGGGENRVFIGGERNFVLTGTGDDTVVSIAVPTVSLIIQAITGVELPTGNVAITGAGRDNVILIGRYNAALTGNDHDIAILGGEYNFLAAGAGDDISLLVGKHNLALYEGGRDIGLAIGQNNIVFSGSGDDIVGVIGETNVVFGGTGSDLVLAAGKFNFIVTDNELEFSLIQVKSLLGEDDFNPVSDLKLKDGDQFSVSATPFADISAFFPDIEFSDPDVPDYEFPTLTLDQYDLPIPSIPELRGAPEYQYGELGNYGLPEISLPTISTPELQLPGQSFPSISIPDITAFNLQVDQAGVQIEQQTNISNNHFGAANSFGRDFLGANSSDGNAGTIFGTETDLTFWQEGEDYGVEGYTLAETNFGVGDADGSVDVSGTNTGFEDSGSFTAATQGNYNLLDTSLDSQDELNIDRTGVEYDFSVDVQAGDVVSGSIEGSVAVPFSGTPVATHNTLSINGTQTDVALNLTNDKTYEVQVSYLASSVAGTEADDIIVYYTDERGKQEIGRIDPTAANEEQTAKFRFRAEDGGSISVESQSGGAPVTEITGVDVYKSDVSLIELPTVSLPDLTLPEFHLNGLDLSGLEAVETALSGRELFGLQVPEFDIPSEGLKVPDFDLSEHVNRDEVKLEALSYTIPALNIPNIAGIQWDERIGDYSHEFSLLQSQVVEAEESVIALNPDYNGTGDTETVYGDIAVAVGEENHVYTGRGDDAALLVGKKNVFYGGSEDDIAILAGETNLGILGTGNNVALAIGKTNRLAARGGTDFLITIGEENKITSAGDNTAVLLGKKNEYEAFNTFSGSDVVLSAGQENDVKLGYGNDTAFVIGYKNEVAGQAADDIIVALGFENEVKLGTGSDFGVIAGIKNEVLGDATGQANGSDIIFTLGAANRVDAGGGTDSIFTLGLANLIIAGGDADLVITGGVFNATSLGDGNDALVNFGAGSFTTGGLGDDYLIDMGVGFATFGNDGNDTFLSAGYGFTSGGAGNDHFLNFGLGTLEAYAEAGITILGDAIGGVISALEQVSSLLGAETFKGPSQFLVNGTGVVSQGGGGDDVFFSGFGRTVALGQTGDDSYIYTIGSGELVIGEHLGTDILGELDSQRFNVSGLNEGLAGESSLEDIARGDEVNTIFIETARTDLTTDLTIDNLKLSNSDATIDIVVNGASVGKILQNGLGDNDVFRLKDHDSTSNFTFAELKANAASAAPSQHTDFDSASVLAQGLQETLNWLNSVEAADAETSETGRELSTGEFAVVAEVYDTIYDAKTAVDGVIANKTDNSATSAA
nr:LamG-like jellyroll fold domain-containing protein [Ruegeria atlantica]